MRKILTVWVCAVLCVGSMIAAINVENSAKAKEVVGVGVLYMPHSPIRINSNADFAAHANGGGNGTAGNPWIIQNYEINGTEYGYCMYVGNTTEHFAVRDCYLFDGNAEINYFPYYPNSGLTLNRASNATISNNIIEGNEHSGIYLTSSFYNVIISNSLSGNGFSGLLIEYSDDNVIDDNNIYENNNGIYYSSSNNNTANNNEVLFNTYNGISLTYHSDGNRLECNRISDSTFGYYIEQSNDIEILEDEINLCTIGIGLFSSSNISLDSSTLLNHSDGMRVENCNGISVMKSFFLDNFQALRCFDSVNVSLNESTISNNLGGAMYLNNVAKCDFRYNRFESNYMNIYIDSAERCIISENTITNSTWGAGIYAQYFNNSIIKNNFFSGNNNDNFFLVYANNNVVQNNIFKFAGGAGLDIMQSQNNTIYHNSFIGNSIQAYQLSSATFWDNGYPSGGNYWSDYAGADEFSGQAQDIPGSDNIGDTPYTNIAGGSGARDRYPLMSPDVPGAGPNVFPIQPSAGEINVPIDTDIIALFTRSMNASVIPSLAQTAGTSVTYSFTGWSSTHVANDTATWTHGEDWEKNDAITLIISGYMDTDGNTGPDCTWSFDTEDTEPPISIVNVISPYWIKAKSLAVTVNASDESSGVANVSLWYRYSPDNSSWGEWVTFGTLHSEPWSWTFNFSNGEGHYEFHSVANDTVGNEELPPLEADTGCAYDATAPILVDNTQVVATTGDVFAFTASAADNFEIAAVHVIYWFGRRAKTNATMVHTSGDNYEFEIPIPSDNLLEMYYWIAVADKAGNWKTTPMRLVPVNDDDAPVAVAGSDRIIDEGGTVQFNGTASTDNIGVTNWSWSFMYGGGEVRLYGSLAEFTFIIPGVYDVTLNVTDAAGNWNADNITVTVLDLSPPVAIAGPDQTVNAGTLVTFTGAGSTDNVGIMNYTWAFTHNGTAITLYGVSPTFRFWTVGNYTVVLTVRDAADNSDMDTMIVRVNAMAEEEDDDDDPTPEQDNFLANLWWLWILIILAVIGLLMALRRKTEPAEAVAESTESQALQTEPCPNCGFDIEKGAPCPFCAPVPEPVPEPEPPKPGLSNQDKLDRIEKAYKEGKMSEEQYLRNKEKFSKN